MFPPSPTPTPRRVLAPLSTNILLSSSPSLPPSTFPTKSAGLSPQKPLTPLSLKRKAPMSSRGSFLIYSDEAEAVEEGENTPCPGATEQAKKKRRLSISFGSDGVEEGLVGSPCAERARLRARAKLSPVPEPDPKSDPADIHEEEEGDETEAEADVKIYADIDSEREDSEPEEEAEDDEDNIPVIKTQASFSASLTRPCVSRSISIETTPVLASDPASEDEDALDPIKPEPIALGSKVEFNSRPSTSSRAGSSSPSSSSRRRSLARKPTPVLLPSSSPPRVTKSPLADPELTTRLRLRLKMAMYKVLTDQTKTPVQRLEDPTGYQVYQFMCRREKGWDGRRALEMAGIGRRS